MKCNEYSHYDHWILELTELIDESFDLNEIFFDPAFKKMFTCVEAREQMHSGRWEERLRSVFKFNGLGHHYIAFEWNEGLTEMQDAEPEAEFYEVFPREIVTTVYSRKD